MKKNIYLLILLILPLLICGVVAGQSVQENRIIPLKKGIYTVSELIVHLEEIPDLQLSYNSKDLPVKTAITVGKSDPSLSELIGYIRKQGRIEVFLNDNYLVFREKELENEYTIEGKVTDSKTTEPLVGVTVYFKELKQGTITDSKGYYRLSARPGDYTLVFSFVGYVTKEVNIQLYSNQSYDAALEFDRILLSEIKIIGERQFFGNLKEGRTIESIEMKEIESIKTNNVSDVIQARMPGVWVTKVSGAPGDHNQIRIRGINSLFGGVDPLYVIDGVPVPIVNLHSLGISDLNIHDVENITVLKDASSNAIYGFQGGNGVIIIDTKRGGESGINFSVTQGVQETSRRYNLFNSTDLINSLDSAAKYRISRINKYYPDITDTLCSDDWQNELLQAGRISEYQLSASGNVKKTKYYLSGNYFSHEGIVTNTSYSKYSFSAALGRSFFDRLSIEGVYKNSFQENRNNLDSYWGNRVIIEEINKSPAYNCTPSELYQDSLGNVFVRTYINYPDLHTRENPYALIQSTNKDLNVSAHNFSGFASFRVLENLRFNYSVAYSTRKHKYTTKITAYDYFYELNNYLQSKEKYALINNQFNLSYNITSGKHQVKMVASSKFYRDMVEWNLDSLASEFESNTNQENLFTRGNLSILGENGRTIRHINSYIGHINYSFSDKYYISLAMNYENLKEGATLDISQFFPSVALKWDISKELGLNRISLIDQFNLIYNWGKSGNYPLNGLSKDLFSSERYIYPDNIYYGYAVDNLANHYLKPEIVEGYNAGAEISLFKKRILFTVSYYTKTNHDLIVQRNIPYYYGGGRLFINVAEMQIKGFEYKFETWPVVRSNWEWYNRFNLSTFNQEVNKLDGDDKYFYNEDILIPDFVIKEGGDLGNILGYEYLGKVEHGASEEDYENIIFIDGGMFRNLDSVPRRLDSLDKVVIGNMMPDFTFNFFSSVRYKNFSLDMLWYGVIGVDKFNSTRASTYITGLNHEVNRFIADTNEVITAKAFYQSSYFVENAGFIRLKNISLNYSPEKLLYKKIKMKFTLGIDNLITITKYKGYDPEATIYTDNTFSDNAVDLGAYPNPRSYYISVNFKF